MKYSDEEKIKKKLDIQDWRNLSKDKVIEFVSMMPDMDKEVMFEVIKKFPEFTKFGKNILDSLNESAKQLSESNSKDLKEYMKFINETQLILRQELNKENITNNEKVYIINQIMKLAEMVKDMDKDNKNLFKKNSDNHYKMGATLGVLALVALGGKVLIRKIID